MSNYNSSLTQELQQQIAARDSAETMMGEWIASDHVEILVEALRDVGILKVPAQIDYSLLDR